MSAFHGKIGKVQWDTATGNEVNLPHVTGWKATVSADDVDVSEMTGDWKSRVIGFNDWSATVESFTDDTVLSIPLTTGGTEALGENTPARLELFFDATGGAGNVILIHGSAICTSIKPSTDSNGAAKTTYTFMGNGALTWATTEPV